MSRSRSIQDGQLYSANWNSARCVLSFGLVVSAIGCGPALTDDLPDEVVDVLGSLPAQDVDLQRVILPNGQTIAAFRHSYEPAPSGLTPRTDPPEMTRGPQYYKNRLISEMIFYGAYLTNRPSWQFAGDPTTKPAAPAQNGLAYSWGQKDPNVRMRPPGEGGVCDTPVYGLDCSGLIYQVANHAGVTIPVSGSAWQRDADNWTKNLPQEWSLKAKQIDSEFVETGDLLGWNGHIGLVAVQDGVAKVFQSNGYGTNIAKCDQNLKCDSTGCYGPNIKDLGAMENSPPKGWGVARTVIRFVADLSGMWNLDLRCAGAATDAVQVLFRIDDSENGKITGQGSATDYTKAKITYEMSGVYHSAESILDVILTFTAYDRSQQRQDRLRVKFISDDTGYVDLERLDSGGDCSLQARLKRVSRQ